MKVSMIALRAKAMKAAEAGKYVGFCLACGKKHSGVEPDARKYLCSKCGKEAVFGAEEIACFM